MSEENDRFSANNELLEKEVNKLGKENTRFEKSNAKLEKNVKKLSGEVERMGEVCYSSSY